MTGQSEENVLTFPKGFPSPGDTGGFLWNCDCSIWQKEPIWNFGFFSQFQFQVLVGGGTFYANSGLQGHWHRNSGYFRNIKNIFFSVDLGQNLLNTTRLLQFLFHSRVLFCIISLHGERHNDKTGEKNASFKFIIKRKKIVREILGVITNSQHCKEFLVADFVQENKSSDLGKSFNGS